MPAAAIRENTRRNESLDRGSVSVTGSAVVTVTGTPGPVRAVTSAQATIVAATAPALDPILATVGNIGSGGGNAANQFTIFLWKATSSSNPTLIASTTATTVNWEAWGNIGIP